MALNVCKLYTNVFQRVVRNILVFHAYENNTMVPDKGAKPHF